MKKVNSFTQGLTFLIQDLIKEQPLLKYESEKAGIISILDSDEHFQNQIE